MNIRSWPFLGATVTVAAFAGFGLPGPAHAQGDSKKAQITMVYDAFGKTSKLQKGWGFSTYIEYGGKRILFDTGDNAEIFAHNVKARGIDLNKLDFVVVSHRHGDHTSGLTYLTQVNSKVPIYTPKENFGVFGAALPGKFIKPNDALPAAMRYYDGKVPEQLRFGSAWPKGNFIWVAENMDVAPGFHLILLKGMWGVDLDVMELSLAIDTPDGTVLVVGCSHPTIERVVEAAKSVTNNKPLHLVVGGFHLLPAKSDEINRIANALRDTWKVEYVAPVHCTGEAAFGILKETFGDHYVYAGLSTTLVLGPKVAALGEDGKPQESAMDEKDLRGFHKLMLASNDNPERMLARHEDEHRVPALLAWTP